MTATTRLEVQVAAQKAIATLDEIKAKAQGAESAFAKLQKATSGGFDRLEAALGKMSGQLDKLIFAMDKLGSATGRAGSATRDAASQSAAMVKAMEQERQATDRLAQSRAKAAQSLSDRRYAMSLSAGDRVAALQGKVDAAGYAQATAALQRYNAVVNNTSASKRDILAATSAFKRELAQIPRTASQAHASIRQLSIGTSSLSRLMANTAVVVQGFMAAFAFREILQANITMQQVKLTLNAVAGSARAGAEEFKFAQEIANKYGFSIGEVAKVYGRFLSASKQAGDNEDVTRATFERTAAALRVLGKTDADIEGVFRAFEQIKSKGTVMAEELRLQLGDRIPGAVSLMAKAVGVSNQQLVKMMENGQVSAKYLEAFSMQLLNSVGGYDMAAKAANTLQATLGRLNTAALEAAEKIGQNGFNSAVQRATQSIIDFLKSAEGDRMLKSLGETTKYVADAFVLLFKNADLVLKLLASFAAAKVVSSLISINVAVVTLVKNFSSLGAVISGGGLAGLSAAAGPLAAIAGIVTAIGLTMTDSMKSHRENMQQIAETSKEASEAIAAAYKKVAGNISAPLAAIDAEIDQVMTRYSQAKQEIASAKNDQLGVIAAANRRTPGINYTDISQIKEADLQRDYKEATDRLERFTGVANEAEKALAGLAKRRAENARYEMFADAERDILKAHELIGATKEVSEGIRLIDQAYDLIANKKPIPSSLIDSIARLRAAAGGASDAQKLLDSIKKDLEKRDIENTAQIVGRRSGEGEKDLYKTMMTGSEQMKRAATEAAKNGTSMIAAFKSVAPQMSAESEKMLNRFVATGNAAKVTTDKIGASFSTTLNNLTRVSEKLATGRVDWERYYDEVKKGGEGYTKNQVAVLATLRGGNDALTGAAKAASEFESALNGIMSGAQVTARDVSNLSKALDEVVKRRSELADVEARTRANMAAAKSVGAEEKFSDQLNAVIKERAKLENSLTSTFEANAKKRQQSIEMFEAERTGLDSVVQETKRRHEIENRLTPLMTARQKAEGETRDILDKVIEDTKAAIDVTLKYADAQQAVARAEALRTPFNSSAALDQLSRQASNDNNALRQAGVSPVEAVRITNLNDRQRSAQAVGVVDPEVARAVHAAEVANIDALAAKHAWAAEYIAEAHNNSAIRRLESERDWVSGAELGMRQYMQSAGNASTRMATVVSNAFKSMEDAIVQFSMTGKLSFADLARSVIADMIRMQVQASITTPLMGIMKTGFSALWGAATSGSNPVNTSDTTTWVSRPEVTVEPLMNKLGNAFNDNGIARFAKGSAFVNGIYNTPTLFKFANGSRFGVMGEAGPEAVMPLRRGPDGSLGVMVHGGAGGSAPIVNTTVNVSVEGSASSGNPEMDERQAQRIAKAVDAQVRATVVSELQRQMKGGGMLNRV